MINSRLFGGNAPNTLLDIRFRFYLFRFLIDDRCGRKLTERCPLIFHATSDLQQHHPRNAENVSRNITQLLACLDLAYDPVEGIIRMVFRKRTIAPIEITNQFRAQNFILSARRVPIGSSLKRNLSNPLRVSFSFSEIRSHTFYHSAAAEIPRVQKLG